MESFQKLYTHTHTLKETANTFWRHWLRMSKAETCHIRPPDFRGLKPIRKATRESVKSVGRYQSSPWQFSELESSKVIFTKSLRTQF